MASSLLGCARCSSQGADSHLRSASVATTDQPTDTLLLSPSSPRGSEELPRPSENPQGHYGLLGTPLRRLHSAAPACRASDGALCSPRLLAAPARCLRVTLVRLHRCSCPVGAPDMGMYVRGSARAPSRRGGSRPDPTGGFASAQLQRRGPARADFSPVDRAGAVSVACTAQRGPHHSP